MLHIPMMYALNEAMFNPAGYNTGGIRQWNPHGPDWIYQGGPSGNDLHDVYYNQWDDSENLPTDTHMWATPFDVGDPTGVEPWLNAVGGGIY